MLPKKIFRWHSIIFKTQVLIQFAQFITPVNIDCVTLTIFGRTTPDVTSLNTCIHVIRVIEAKVSKVCLKGTDYWIIIGINYFVSLGVKTCIINLINGQLKGVKVV
jgi:hypothetical protein